MTTLTADRFGLRRGTVATALRAPWSAPAWLATAHLLVGVPGRRGRRRVLAVLRFLSP